MKLAFQFTGQAFRAFALLGFLFRNGEHGQRSLESEHVGPAGLNAGFVRAEPASVVIDMKSTRERFKTIGRG